MKRIIHVCTVCIAVGILTGLAHGGTAQDDVVLDLEFIGDANGNGSIDAGEIVNRLRPHDSAGMTVEVKGTGTLPKLGTFRMAPPPYPICTNDVNGLTFAQDVVENPDGSHTAYKTQVVINNGVVTGLTETVYMRFYWEGPTLPSADCQSILFENGYNDWKVVGGGFGVYLSSSRADAKRTGKVSVFVPQKFPSAMELPVLPNRWTDLFVTLRPGANQKNTVVDAWVCQDTGLYSGGYFGASPLNWAHGSESWGLPLLSTSAEKCNKLFLGAENFGTITIPAGTTSAPSGAKCMRGKIAAVKTWRRMLTTNEMWSVMCGGSGAKWRVGAINNSAEEFAPAGMAAADVYNPLLMPWRQMKRSLTATDRTLTLKFPMTAEDVGKGRILDIVPLCSDVGASCPVDVAVNGELVGRYDLTTPSQRSVYIRASKVVRDASGHMTIALSRPEGCAGVLSFDSLSLSGSWQTGTGTDTATVPNGGMAQEGHNTVYVSFAGNTNYMQTVRALIKSQKNTHVFYVPETDKMFYKHVFRALVGNIGKKPQSIGVTLNGHEVLTREDVVKGSEISVELPDEWIVPGLNEVALNYLNSPNNDWIVFYRFGVETRRTNGMTVIFR